MKNILSTKRKFLTVLVSVFASVSLVAISVFAATTIGTNITTGGEARFVETGGGSEYVALKAPAAVTTNVVWTLPSADGTANQTLVTDGSGALSWASGLTTALASGNIFVGNDSGVATSVAMSGDVTISNAGVATIGAGKVTNAMIAAAAGIPYSKLTIADADLTIAKTSGLQAALDLKSPLASPTFTGTVTLPSGQALIAPALGTPASGVLTNATGLPIGTGVSGLAAGVVAFLATSSSANLITAVTDETGTGALVFGTSPTLATPVLGVASATSVTISTAASGLVLGSGVNATTFSSGATAARAIGFPDLAGTVALTANNLGAFAATTSAQLAGVVSDETGTGVVVLATSPTLVTPVLGVATATSINKVAITAPATSATLTIADGKTLTASNTLTFTGTDASSVAFGAGGTVVYAANNLSVHAATTSAQLAGVISDETGTGVVVLATSPTLVTPALGVATATSIALGGGTAITKHLSATGAINFASMAAQTCATGTVTVTGAVAGNTVVATPTPVASGIDTMALTWSAWVSGADTVTVRACNPTAGALDPADQTWRADVWQH